jgi:hypothetical protein
MEQNRFPKLLSDFNPEAEEAKNNHVTGGEGSFEINSYIILNLVARTGL